MTSGTNTWYLVCPCSTGIQNFCVGWAYCGLLLCSRGGALRNRPDILERPWCVLTDHHDVTIYFAMLSVHVMLDLPLLLRCKDTTAESLDCCVVPHKHRRLKLSHPPACCVFISSSHELESSYKISTTSSKFFCFPPRFLVVMD